MTFCKDCSKKKLVCTCDCINKICPNCKSVFMGSTVGYKYCNHCLVCRNCGKELSTEELKKE